MLWSVWVIWMGWPVTNSDSSRILPFQEQIVPVSLCPGLHRQDKYLYVHNFCKSVCFLPEVFEIGHKLIPICNANRSLHSCPLQSFLLNHQNHAEYSVPSNFSTCHWSSTGFQQRPK